MSSPSTWQPPQSHALDAALSGAQTPSAAADHLASLTLTLDPTRIEDHLDALWHLVLARAAQAAAPATTHPVLVDILVHLARLADAEDPNAVAGQPGEGKLLVQDMRVWRDLPLFGWTVREAWDFSAVPRPGQTVEACRAKGREFVNVNAWTAQLMATEEGVFDFSWLALATLREALEEEEEEGEEENRERRRQRLDVYVPAAAAWIEHLGVQIHGWDERPTSHSASAAAALEEDEENNVAAGGSVAALGRAGRLWKGAHGFGRPRWEFWQGRFATLARAESGLTEEARGAAAEAATLMEEISKGEIVE